MRIPYRKYELLLARDLWEDGTMRVAINDTHGPEVMDVWVDKQQARDMIQHIRKTFELEDCGND